MERAATCVCQALWSISTCTGCAALFPLLPLLCQAHLPHLCAQDGHPFGEMSGMSAGRLDTAKSMGLGVEDGKELDLRTMRDISEKVTPSIGINFCMSDLTWEK